MIRVNPTELSGAFSTQAKFADEAELLNRLVAQAALSPAARAAITRRAADLVRRIRDEAKPTMMEHFLAEYGLSTREGVALMCLAEAMLRVPDRMTIDALIEDKIAPSDWGRHLGEASSSLVNASTWALMLTGKVLDDDQAGIAGTLRRAVRRLGEPVIRTAVGRAMKEMGRQFVLGQTIEAALERASKREAQGFTYSYDMLGEAAMTGADAARYDRAYSDAIAAIAKACTKGSVEENPGISIKLSALHPRYEVAQEARVMTELVPVVLKLARQAKAAGMGMNIDAEEQDRLVLSLKVIEAVLADPSLAGWDGFGVVVQAYGKRAGQVIDWLYQTATRLDRRIMVRLVKGAYWDTEIKRAQVEGFPGFPLFTSKVATDVSYIANARKLIGYADRIYPQFATHNAHTVAAILEMAGETRFEFQRLHGMGERLHDIVLRDYNGRCRIYAPVGAHRDLLAYLVRRLLENGANSSFVHQIVDESVSPEEVARDPFEALADARPPRSLVAPEALFGASRRNSTGFDLTDEETLARIYAARDVAIPDAMPLTVSEPRGKMQDVVNPATGERIARVMMVDAETAARAIEDARIWDAPAEERAAVLRRAADLYEAHYGPIFGILGREAGKSLADAVAELREAVDFLRYYAAEGENCSDAPRGIVGAISPWNFPLAIFTGQIAAALMAGNAVIAKPAEPTPVIAAYAIGLLHQAGVPKTALQLLPGRGSVVGTAMTSDARVAGLVFTGSTETAQTIARTMAANLAPGTPLIAETGGLNAMVVDSTALPEQAVRDIVNSAFRSAGQRCSALRCLYVQEDVAPHLIEMIKGAMDELRVGDPWDLTTDVGPVIDPGAQKEIADYIAANANRVLHRLAAPSRGYFIPPTLLKVSGINDLEREIFGPVLHVATFRGDQLDQVIAEINARGFGLTFGLHTRIDSRVQEVSDAIHVGNIYVNRNQIGAVVGSQPFGGEGLSGTGPKAGGPRYVPRFFTPAAPAASAGTWQGQADEARLRGALAGAAPKKIEEQLMPGPTGELNRLTAHSRPPVLCLGPGPQAVAAQVAAVQALGGQAVGADGALPPEALTRLPQLSAVLWWGDEAQGRAYAQALAAREGEIVQLITAMPDLAHVAHERHLCVDTTAAGGNAALLAG
ncbi:bifunctional proline dehydrogenase/L-glutamate gamma-semialdehyde dehydrogenase PutA [Paracoccus sp. P2]|uniref:Bifunctional protein PutA n=1 Tax=Paracoccus pantotrophus TaxID=82367 RepID=A0A1I5J1E0_PARPN|nr:bifunctional proline dehydrogenase/L-glutamate gamma-semialdehyde dehydrogenase PutA [Paracoccus pantotrophus]MDF3855339.1 bifunctional proline dehydrogenase/L-glutamate gamma-semialdehyde dehydrogenase PutA [Paracoccus pantotrophus]QFG37537.1 bifunctional proline dehydrogenase/L-glutamate gamma-semialdehyde dehydrogenase PutA [Paracoccus pantotrophus]QLH14991.1 bifunctional proline dehydrogenase/L-glutamate gamma-semialdehyde dehydrogenase PutA [Paracoccus pantotrophus]RKS52009.1 L-proline 